MWWLPIVLSPALFFGWVPVHEGSHALAIEAAGHEVTEFAPYPHVYDDRFYLGRVESLQVYQTGQEETRRLRQIAVAPYITDTIVFSSLFLGLHLSRDVTTRWVLTSLIVAPLIDMTFNVLSYAFGVDNDLTHAGPGGAAFVIAADVICIGVTIYEIVRTVRMMREERSERGFPE